MVFPFLVNPQAHVFNHMVTTSTFPDSWKLAHVISIGKRILTVSAEHFLPISILSAHSKIFERLIVNQIGVHWQSNSVSVLFSQSINLATATALPCSRF